MTTIDSNPTSSIVPTLSSFPSFQEWYAVVTQQHNSSIDLDFTEWDNCFGNLYAGSTPLRPKFWSYVTQLIRTENELVKINACVSVALINDGEKVEIDYMFDNSNFTLVMINDVSIERALSLTEQENDSVIKMVQQTLPDLVGLQEALDTYMNQNNYAERWSENHH